MNFRARFRPWIATFALLSTAGFVACGDGTGSGEDFVKDSWQNPTYHGDLQFGSKSPGEFTDEERFHAWTFTLTGDAEVSIETAVSTQNLDTILYLYKKGENGRWGSYLSKNDDGEDLGLGSRIEKSLGAGEYRIKVKAAKSIMTGVFNAGGTCVGAGCPTTEGTCGPEEPGMPPQTEYTKECGAKMHAILTTPVGHDAVACLAENLEERAVEDYLSYFSDFYDIEDEDAPYVDLTHHSGAGTIVSVTFGGDEDEMHYVFDAEGKLLFRYQSNQSPDWAWYCDGTETGTDPGDECATDVIHNSEYRLEDTERVDGSIAVGDAASLPVQVSRAITEYATEQGLGASDDVTFNYNLWTTTYHNGADVTVSLNGADEVGYTVTGEEQWGLTLTFRTDAEGTDFVCKDL